ncbi:MAG: hypothetical protein PSX37_03785 [bacterium]|nr:hypothetical protein [bacterium]
MPAQDATPQQAAQAAEKASLGGNGSGDSIPAFFQLDFACAIRSVLIAMAVVMALAAIVAFVGLRRGLQAEPAETEEHTAAPAG